MKKAIQSILVLGLMLVMTVTLLAPAGAQGKATCPYCKAGSNVARTASAAVKIPNVKLPCTFICKHCGIKITVRTPAEWLKPCPVCPCGTTTAECYPTKGK